MADRAKQAGREQFPVEVVTRETLGLATDPGEALAVIAGVLEGNGPTLEGYYEFTAYGFRYRLLIEEIPPGFRTVSHSEPS